MGLAFKIFMDIAGVGALFLLFAIVCSVFALLARKLDLADVYISLACAFIVDGAPVKLVAWGTLLLAAISICSAIAVATTEELKALAWVKVALIAGIGCVYWVLVAVLR